MTRDQLDAIRARARSIEANKPQNAVWLLVRQDVPALLAEVERLTAERDALVQARENWLADCAKELRETADDMIAIRKEHERAAFQRGVAAMREAAANVKYSCGYCSRAALQRKIRAIPDPEDTP